MDRISDSDSEDAGSIPAGATNKADIKRQAGFRWISFVEIAPGLSAFFTKKVRYSTASVYQTGQSDIFLICPFLFSPKSFDIERVNWRVEFHLTGSIIVELLVKQNPSLERGLPEACACHHHHYKTKSI
jgi:hypothetical protein